MRAVDTNLLVRLFALDDAKQSEKVEDYIEFGAWVSHLVLAEAVWVFRSVYGASRESVIAATGMLLTHDRLSLEDGDLVFRSVQLFAANPKVSFTDCLVHEIARKAGHTPLGTFDRALGKLPGAKTL